MFIRTGWSRSETWRWRIYVGTGCAVAILIMWLAIKLI